MKPALTSEVDANFSQFWSTRAYASANPPVSPVVNAWQKLNVSAPLRAAYSSSAQNAFLLTQDSLLVVTQQTPAANETSSIVNVHKVSPVDDGATSVLTPISDGVVVVSANGEMLVCHCTPAACSESITCARRTVAISNASAAAFAAGSPEQLWIGHSSGVTVVNMTSGAATKLGITTAAVTSISLLGKYAVVATDEAVFDFDGETWHHTLIGGVIDGPPTATAILPNRTNPTSGSPLAVIGDAYCLHFLNFHTGLVQRVSSMEGLPYGNVTALNAATNGDRLWVGTTWGLVLLDVVALFQSEGSSRTSAWRYFAGPRWLPDDQVVSVVGDTRSLSTESLAPQLLVVTSSGIALLSTTTLTLADKAVHYQAMTAPRHDRYGYVARVALTNFGDLESFDRVDGDNDGSWTSYYMSSQIYRYMATKDPAAKESAWHAFRAVEFLHNVTGQAGFIARTLVKCGEPHQGPDSPVNGWHNSTQCYDGYDDNAPGATDGCCWTWKGDTSTDETDGHFYGLALAHDSLAETDAERARIARLICAMTSYIVDNKFMYVDVTGYNTTWGYWAPDVLNGIPGKPNERGLNSLEILSYLGTSMHVCTSDMPHPANTTFASALAWLVRQHGYGRNLVNVRLTAPNGIAFFDFGNAFYTYLNMHSHAPWTAPEKSRDSSSKRFKDQEPPLTKDEMEVLKGQFYQGLEVSSHSLQRWILSSIRRACNPNSKHQCLRCVVGVLV